MNSQNPRPNARSGQPVNATVTGRYQLTEWLGRTVIADEYRAHDLHLDRTVIFKALLPELVSDRGFLDRFRSLAQSAANLSHPAIAAVLDWGRDTGGIPDGAGGTRVGPTYYLVSEAVEGRSLEELVEANGAMPPDRVSHVVVGLTSALAFAHRSGVIDAGLDPCNVMVSPTGVVKIADLGLRRALGTGWQPGPADTAVAKWMAPEQFRGEEPTEKTDVYQIGLLAYYIATGRSAYSGPSLADYSRQHREQVPVAPTKANAAIPKAVESFIGRSMAKVESDRYQTLAEQRAAIVRVRDRITGSVSANRRLAEVAPDNTAMIATGTADSPAPSEGRRAGDTSIDRDQTRVSTVDQTVVAQAATAPERETRASRKAARNVPPTIVASNASRTPEELDETRVALQQDRRGNRRGPINAGGRLPDGPENDFAMLDKKRSRRGLYALTLLVLLAILAGLLLLLARQLGLTGTTTGQIEVPSVEQQTEAQARQVLTDFGLRVETVRVTSATVGADIVVKQSPQAGSRVSEGALVNLEVSTGSNQPTVPKVVGMSVDQAKSQLASYGFSYTIVEKKDDSAEQGSVVSQEPRPDTPVEKGATITLEVAVSSSKKTVPKVEGKTADDARIELAKEGFLSVVASEPSNTVEKGIVIRTEPAGGVSVAKGSPVTMFISGGKAIAIPSMIGKDEATARQVLQDLGLVVVVKYREEADPLKADKVVAQTPADGDVEVGATVTLRIAKDSIASTTPDAGAASSGTGTAGSGTAATAGSGSTKSGGSSKSTAVPVVETTTPLQTVATLAPPAPTPEATPSTAAPAPAPAVVPAPVPVAGATTQPAGGAVPVAVNTQPAP